MPRMPILVEGGEWCRGEISQIYAAYSDGIAYMMKVVSKVKPPIFCPASERKEFDEMSFAKRIIELKQIMSEVGNSSDKISKNSVIKVSGNDFFVKLINDFENKRWFEFSVSGANESKTEVTNFLASLKLDNQIKGIEIGQGAEQLYGDDAQNSIKEETFKDDKGVERKIKRLLIKSESKENSGIKVLLKPRANYTETAKKLNTQGKVVLRVTFLANGAIGSISVVSGLDDGLTEEAIKAARKILFLPARRDGFRYSVAKPVEYTFTIY